MGGRGSASGQARTQVVNEEGRFTAKDVNAALAGGRSVQLSQTTVSKRSSGKGASVRDKYRYHATIDGRRRRISSQAFNALQRQYSPRIASSEDTSGRNQVTRLTTYSLSQDDWVRRNQRNADNKARARSESGVTDEMRRAERQSARQQRQSESMLMRSIRWS